MGCERRFDERRRISVPLSDEYQWSICIPQQWRDHRYQRLSVPATTTLAAATLALTTSAALATAALALTTAAALVPSPPATSTAAALALGPR